MSLAVLRRHINPLDSPLYHLPSDLFPEIVSHLSSETDLINATHISYHLRNTLLSYPNLWSHIDFEHELRARTFLERSGQTPLHIDMGEDGPYIACSLAELRQQSRRIAMLKLPYWPVQKGFLSEPLPSLRRLEVVSNSDRGYDRGDGWDTFYAPVWGPMEKTTSWSFPSLTSLIVHELSPIPVQTPLLTCFKFRTERGRINVDELLNFLDGCPLLEHIDIFHPREPLQGKPSLAVSLPNLRTYTQTAFGKAPSPTIFDALSLPPFCLITFRSQGAEETYDILPHFENPDYLAEIKRIELRTTDDAEGREVAGTLEFVNAKGMKMCSERMVDFEDEEGRPCIVWTENDALGVAHLNFLRKIDGRSVETLCIDGCRSPATREVAPKFLMGVLGFGNVRTLILSSDAVWSCLAALNKDPGASGHGQWFFLIHALVIRPDPGYHIGDGLLSPLLRFARKRKSGRLPVRIRLAVHSVHPGTAVVSGFGGVEDVR